MVVLSAVSMSVAAVIIFGLIYFAAKDRKKPVAAEVFGILAVVAVGAVVVSSMGWVDFGVSTTAPYAAPGTPGYVPGYVTPGIPDDSDISTILTNGDRRPIDSLTVITVEADSNKQDQCEDNVSWFDSTSDPRLSSSYSLDTTTITAGRGTDTSTILETEVAYYGIFHDTTTAPNPTYYDGVLGAGVYDPRDPPTTVVIKAPPTTDAEVTAIVRFGMEGTAPIWKIATIPDILDETDITGNINGMTSTATIAGGTTATANFNSTNEIQIGGDNTPADDDTVYYNETNGDGTFTLELTFGAGGSNAFLKRPVLCFSNDRTNPCEGTEFDKITAQRESGAAGSDVVLPSDLTTYFVSMPACVEIGGQTIDGVAYIGSGVTATYTLTFTVNHDYADGTADVFYITPDDLGGYMAQDLIPTGQGASPSASDLTFSFR